MPPCLAKRMFRWVLAALAIVLGSAQGYGQTENIVPSTDSPYCGMYAVYAAARLYHRDVDLPNLVRPSYISRQDGSTLRDVIQAIEDQHLHCASFQGLTVLDISQSPYPVILWIKSGRSQVKYDHFVLAVGVQNDAVTVVDGPIGKRDISLAEFAQIWGGTGIVVSDKPIHRWEFLFAGWCRIFIIGALSVIGILLIRFYSPTIPALASTRNASALAFQVMLIVASSIIGATAHHAMAYNGFLSHPKVTSVVDDLSVIQQLPRLSVNDAAHLRKKGAALVDARIEEDFKHANIAGSINVPVDASAVLRHERMMSVPKSAIVIVFCKSEFCTFDEHVARQLIADGYKDVRIFTGGWDAWKESMSLEVTGPHE